MRKHFLLFLLMALLPLVGWAGNVTITPHVINVYYPATAVPAVTAEDFALTGDLPGGFGSWEEARQDLIENDNLTITIVGGAAMPELTGSVKYYFSVVGELSEKWGETTFSMAYNGDLNVLPRDLSTVNFYVPAGDNVTNGEFTYTYDGNAKTPEPIVWVGDGDYNPETSVCLTKGTDFDFEYTHNTDANGVVIEGTTITIPQIKIVPAENQECYTGFKTLPFTINKANILATDFTAPAAIAGLSYNAAPKNLITAGSIPEAKGTFQYKLGEGDYSAVIPQGTAAGNYTVKYKIVGSGNYNDYTETIPPVEPATVPTIKSDFDVEGVSIAKAMLVVQPKKTLNVLYSGEAIPDGALEALGLSYTRFYGNDTEALFEGHVPTLKVAAAVGTAAYAVNTYVEGIEVVMTGVPELDNYEVYPVNGDLNINAIKVKVELNNGWQKVATFGTPEAGVPSWSLPVADAAKLTVNVQTGYVDDEPIYGAPVENPALYLKTTEGDAPEFDGLTISRASTSDAVGKYPVTLSGTLPINANYVIAAQTVAAAIEGDEPQPAPTFEIVAADPTVITIKAGNKAMVYGSKTEPALTFTVSGTTLTDAQKATIQAAMQRAEGTDVGVYEINFKKGVTEGNGPEIDGFDINYETGAFAITPATLTITAQPQTLYAGYTVAKLDQKKFDVDGLVEGDTEPVPAVELAFIDGVAVDEEGKLTVEGDKVVYADPAGIKVTVTNADDFALNYELVILNGTLTVKAVNGELSLWDGDPDVLEKINAYNGKEGVTVKIKIDQRDRQLNGARTWAAERWNTMTLPFDITVAELSKILGYAVVNVVDAGGYSTSETGAPVYKFNLTMKGGYDKDYLPANKPFTIKTTDALNAWIEEHGEEGYLDFGTRTIVAPTEVDFAGVAAGGGSTFKPAYAKRTIDKNDEGNIWFLLGNYTKWAYIKSTSPATWDIVPFEGFIDQSNNNAQAPAAAIFIMEEPDGSTTAIKGVEIDNINGVQNAEGLYNLNGMKLMSVPTQKGVYIQNGKKVIIK